MDIQTAYNEDNLTVPDYFKVNAGINKLFDVFEIFSRVEKLLGASYVTKHAYIGIPVIHMLEGVKPKKNRPDFDRPLDMIVTMTDSNGKSVHFIYNEICCN